MGDLMSIAGSWWQVEEADHITLSEERVVVSLVELELMQDTEQDKEVHRLALALTLSEIAVVAQLAVPVPFGLEALVMAVLGGEGDILVELVAVILEAEDLATALVRF